MAKLMSVVGFVLVASVVGTAAPAVGEQLPQLNVIHTATLSPSYGCRDRDAFAQGYQHTAL